MWRDIADVLSDLEEFRLKVFEVLLGILVLALPLDDLISISLLA